MPDQKTIPQRADIDAKFTWDLSDIYPDHEAWESAYRQATAMIAEAGKFKGQLADSGTLFECLSARTKLSILCDNLFHYARRSGDLDHRISLFQELSERAVRLDAEASAAFSYIEPELLQIDDRQLLQMAAHFPQQGIYDFYIRELIRSRTHIRSAEVEELLAQSAVISRGPYNIFTMLNNADLTYPVILDEQGQEVKLTKERFSKFMDSPQQRVRRDAYCGLYSSYKEHANTLAAALASSINKDVFQARARKFESCLHQALDAYNIPISVYHALIETTEKNLEGLHEWTALRKRILKLDQIYPYDMTCPLFPEENYEVTYEEAMAEVIDATAPLGRAYVDQLKRAFDSRWVDVYETEGKASGAYSATNYATHPLVLMNYNGTIDHMFTLAHEMGHCLHSFLSCGTQPYPKARYSIFVAEVASTLNEGLLLQHLLSKVDNPRKRLFLLNRHIDNTFGTFFHQVLYSHFELEIHDLVEKGQALSPDTLCRLWEELTLKYYGPQITMDEYTKYKWARIPHFYYTYYVYHYATSYAASGAILERFNSRDKDITDKYLELLRSGGNDYPIEQLKKCGVDMTTSAPVEATLRLFAGQVEEVARLAG